MDGFKNSTKMKYMTGGEVSAYKMGGSVKSDCAPVKKAMGGPAKKMCGGVMKKAAGGVVKKAMGGTMNEKGKRASLAEMEAEDRRMGSKMAVKKPMQTGSGIGTAVTTAGAKVAEMVRKGVPAYNSKPMIRK